jgi:hypothetical protein
MIGTAGIQVSLANSATYVFWHKVGQELGGEFSRRNCPDSATLRLRRIERL